MFTVDLHTGIYMNYVHSPLGFHKMFFSYIIPEQTSLKDLSMREILNEVNVIESVDLLVSH